MLDIFQYEFIQNAIIAGVLVSILSGIIGSLVVVNRMVFLAGGVAHASYGGIGIAIFFSMPIFLFASLFALFSAWLIALVTLKKRQNSDTFIGLIWAVGMAIGIIFVDLTPGYNVDLMSYLFGSILAVSKSDIYYIFSLVVATILIITLFYKEILAVSYDSEYAYLRGINTKFFYSLILILSALVVVVSIKIVGLILVIALLTIPVYIANIFSTSLKSMMILSSIISTTITLIGLYISYIFDLTSGATIILVGAVFMIVAMIYERFAKSS
jgi:zinc transport system permease protein